MPEMSELNPQDIVCESVMINAFSNALLVCIVYSYWQPWKITYIRAQLDNFEKKLFGQVRNNNSEQHLKLVQNYQTYLHSQVKENTEAVKTRSKGSFTSPLDVQGIWWPNMFIEQLCLMGDVVDINNFPVPFLGIQFMLGQPEKSSMLVIIVEN